METKRAMIFATCVKCGNQLTYQTDAVEEGFWPKLTDKARELGWVQTIDGWVCPAHEEE